MSFWHGKEKVNGLTEALTYAVVCEALEAVLDAFLDVVRREDVDDAHVVHLLQRLVELVRGAEAAAVGVEHTAHAPASKSTQLQKHTLAGLGDKWVCLGQAVWREGGKEEGVLFGRCFGQALGRVPQGHRVRSRDRLANGLALALCDDIVGHRIRRCFWLVPARHTRASRLLLSIERIPK